MLVYHYGNYVTIDYGDITKSSVTTLEHVFCEFFGIHQVANNEITNSIVPSKEYPHINERMQEIKKRIKKLQERK